MTAPKRPAPTYRFPLFDFDFDKIVTYSSENLTLLEQLDYLEYVRKERVHEKDRLAERLNDDLDLALLDADRTGKKLTAKLHANQKENL